MIYRISGKDNKNLKLVKQLKRKHGRDNSGKFFAEGKKMALEAFEYFSEGIDFVVVSDEFYQNEFPIVEMADNVCSWVYVVSKNIFDDLCDTETPQGILVVMDTPKDSFVLGAGSRYILVLDGVSEPGNMGTIIRTAEAFGFDAVYLMKGSADIYSPKTVRATMGSVFRMKFKYGCAVSDLDALKENGFLVVATTPVGDASLEGFKSPEKVAVVIGNEAHGVSAEVMKMSDVAIKITMDGNAESLNAAVAAGVVMHWVKNV